MNKIILLIAACVLCFAAQAQQPIYSPQSLISNKIVDALVYSNINAVIDCRKQASVGLVIDYTQMGTTNTATNAFAFLRSVDGSATNYETATNLTVVNSAALNGRNVIFTNLLTYGCGYIKLTNIYCGNPTTSITNITITYGVKVNAP